MKNEHEILEEILERILAKADEPDGDKELLRDLVAYLQKQLRAGKTLQELAKVLEAMMRGLGNGKYWGTLDENSTESEEGVSDGKESEVAVELWMRIEGLPRKAIVTLFQSCLKDHPATTKDSQEGPRS